MPSSVKSMRMGMAAFMRSLIRLMVVPSPSFCAAVWKADHPPAPCTGRASYTSAVSDTLVSSSERSGT